PAATITLCPYTSLFRSVFQGVALRCYICPRWKTTVRALFPVGMAVYGHDETHKRSARTVCSAALQGIHAAPFGASGERMREVFDDRQSTRLNSSHENIP